MGTSLKRIECVFEQDLCLLPLSPESRPHTQTQSGAQFTNGLLAACLAGLLSLTPAGVPHVPQLGLTQNA